MKLANDQYGLQQCILRNYMIQTKWPSFNKKRCHKCGNYSQADLTKFGYKPIKSTKN